MYRPTYSTAATPEFRSCNKRLVLVIGCGLMFFLAGFARGGSATWDLNPGSGDWNTSANWTPTGVPNGPADIASFGLSNTTNVSISANTEVDSIIFSSAATNPYTITANPGLTLTVGGSGITNNSGVTQNFVTMVSGFSLGRISFTNNATAGSLTRFTNNGSALQNQNFPGGVTDFLGSASAAYGTFTNNGGINSGAGGGVTAFSFSATAANGTFINNGGMASFAGGGLTNFELTTTAANGTFTNNGGTASFADGGSTQFNSVSSAANGTFINNASTVSGASGGQTTFRIASSSGSAVIHNNGATVDGAVGGTTAFFDISTAANATITNNGATGSGAVGGKTMFFDKSTADSATLIANSGTGGGEGGQILFGDRSTGGTSRIEVFGNGSLDISLAAVFSHPRTSVGIGSVEGDGIVFLGHNNLTVGRNDLSTEFSGVIQDGGLNGALTKIGSGTLDLTGVNTYTGTTIIKAGALQVDGSITSDTFVDPSGSNHSATLAGTGIIHGSVINNGTVSPGHPLGALTVNSYTQMKSATLLIDIEGSGAGQFSVLDVLGHAGLNGRVDPLLLNGFIPTVGESFTFLHYASATGTLFIHNPNIDNAMEHWEIIYQPTEAILTVASGNVPVPDRGSTFLLLTLSLLGLTAFRGSNNSRNYIHYT